MLSRIGKLLGLGGESQPRTVTVIPGQIGLRIRDSTSKKEHSVNWAITTSQLKEGSITIDGETRRWLRGIWAKGTTTGHKIIIHHGDDGRKVTVEHFWENNMYTFKFGDETPILYTKESITREFDGGKARVEIVKLEDGSHEITFWDGLKQQTEKC